MVLYKEKNNRILKLLFFLISINVGLFGQDQQVDKTIIPPLPRNGVDTMILRQSSDAIKTWLEICILEDHETDTEIYERDKCEEEAIKNFILRDLQLDISEESGKVTLEYVIEKEREIGWIRIKEDTTKGKIGKLLKASFEKIKMQGGRNWKWSYPSSKYRLCRVLKEITIELG